MFLNTENLKSEEIYLRLDKTEEGNQEKQLVPAYYFSICLVSDGTAVGKCDFRIGHTERLFFGGNIGYTVYEQYRGRHYAAKACRLLFKLAEMHNMKYLYITCSPNNYPSRRTCEHAGGTLQAIINLPEDNDMYKIGERQKCIYFFNICSEDDRAEDK